MSRRIYADPPIEEALCEFRFEGESEWHPLLTPASMRGALEHAYPGPPLPQEQWEANFSRGEGSPTTVAIRQTEAGFRFPDGAGNFISLAPGSFAVHTLRPYVGWEEFRTRIAAALDVYLGLRRPSRLSKVSLRYINKISVPQSSIRLDEYFNAVPPSIPGLPERVGSFLQRTEYIFADDVRLSVMFTNGIQGMPKGDSLEFLLDLEASWGAKETHDPSKAMPIVDDLRARERDAFEALVTDRAREIFRELGS